MARRWTAADTDAMRTDSASGGRIPERARHDVTVRRLAAITDQALRMQAEADAAIAGMRGWLRQDAAHP
jgi:hypothetical protein